MVDDWRDPSGTTSHEEGPQPPGLSYGRRFYDGVVNPETVLTHVKQIARIEARLDNLENRQVEICKDLKDLKTWVRWVLAAALGGLVAILIEIAVRNGMG